MTTTTRPAELNDGIWTSWLPVTTAWPSQAACDTAIWARVGINTDSGYWPYIFDPEYGQSVANTPTCLPPAATQWWEQTPDTDLPQITSYSLGPLVCPEAYTTVTTTVVKSSSTSVICCPSNFDFTRGMLANTGVDGVCTSTMTSGQALTYASPVSQGYRFVTTTFDDDQYLLLAAPMQGWKFAAETTSSSSTIPTSSERTSSPASSSPTSSSTNEAAGGASSSSTPVNQSEGLSTGAKVGIGVAVPLGVLALIAVAAFLFFRRRRRNRETAVEIGGSREVASPGNTNGYYEPQTKPVEMFTQPSEIDGVQKRPTGLYA